MEPKCALEYREGVGSKPESRDPPFSRGLLMCCSAQKAVISSQVTLSTDGVTAEDVEGSGAGVADSCKEGREGDKSVWSLLARDSNPESSEYEA